MYDTGLEKLAREFTSKSQSSRTLVTPIIVVGKKEEARTPFCKHNPIGGASD
jgi:hypothetical protein